MNRDAAISLHGKSLAELKALLNPRGRAAFADLSAALHREGRHGDDRLQRRICRRIIRIQSFPLGSLMLEKTLEVGRMRPAMAAPFLKALWALNGSRRRLHDYADAVAALSAERPVLAAQVVERTPAAVGHFGADNIGRWMQAAMDTDSMGLPGPAEAFLEASTRSGPVCSLHRWRRLLKHAGEIARISPRGAAAFIRYGHQAVGGLDDVGIAAWIAEAADQDLDDRALFSWFLGTSSCSVNTARNLLPAVGLEACRPVLALLCKALVGREVILRPLSDLARGRTGSGGPATDGHDLFLPERAASFEAFKIMALHQAVFLCGETEAIGAAGDPSAESGRHIQADRWLVRRLPGTRADMRRLYGTGLPADYPDGDPGAVCPPAPWWGERLQACGDDGDPVSQILQERAAALDAPVELVAALLRQVTGKVRGDPDALWEMLRVLLDDIQFESPGAEDLPGRVETFFYPEWDDNLSVFRPDWCMVRQIRPDVADNGYAAAARKRLSGTIALIRRQFLRLKPRYYRKRNAQPDGDELDIDAVIRTRSDLKSGNAISDRIYIRRDKRVRDVGVCFLLDMSRSMAETIDGRPMIDIQKDAILIMAEALDAIGDPFAIFGFSSEGRFRVNLYAVKRFDEPYGEPVGFRIGRMAPERYTRMGAVIRHGIGQLSVLPAATKILMVFTDGKPFDLEYGGTAYALADTMKAFKEAGKQGVHPFCITTDAENGHYLDRIIRRSRRLVLCNPAQLPALMPRIYRRLTL